jgi:7-cyano-7-deazaguanine synthase
VTEMKTATPQHQPNTKGALVVLSGGIDSTTCLAIACNKWGISDVRAISFDYGQKHNRTELHAAREIARFYSIDHQVVKLHTGIGGLTDPTADIPNKSYADIEGVSPTYVPFRNGLMISQAVSFANAANLAEVYFGAHADDASGDAYPDCTLEFVGAMSAAVHRGTYGRTRLVAPLITLEKWEIIQKGYLLCTPYELTWSCYRGEHKQCGTCPTCIARKEAFVKAGVEDPTEYAA